MKDRYGVVVCPNCEMAKGIDLGKKTTKCQRCGKRWQIKELRILYKTNSARELPGAVAIINEKISKNKIKNKDKNGN